MTSSTTRNGTLRVGEGFLGRNQEDLLRTPDPRPLIVEFVGLPGAGKSTIAARLVAACDKRGVACGDRQSIGGQEVHRARHYLDLGWFFLRHPGEVISALRLAFTGSFPRPLRLYQAVKYVSLWSYRLAQVRRLGYDLVILDQGVVQNTWSLMLRGPWRDDKVQAAASRVIQAAGMRYALVYFTVSVDAAVQRIGQRPTMESRFDHLNLVEATGELGREGERLRALFARVADAVPAVWCQVDANLPMAETYAEVEAFVDRVQAAPLQPMADPHE